MVRDRKSFFNSIGQSLQIDHAHTMSASPPTSEVSLHCKKPKLRINLKTSIPDQVARDVVSTDETVERLAYHEVPGDLPFELDTVGVVVGHGFHPPKAR